MTYDTLGAGALDYMPCRYDGSKLLFRCPERRLDAPFVAFFGGTATYGKYIKNPFPALVESWQDGVPEFRPRFAEWPEITEVVQEWGTRMMLGEVTTEEGAKELGDRMEAILETAGYYDGSKPKAQ